MATIEQTTVVAARTAGDTYLAELVAVVEGCAVERVESSQKGDALQVETVAEGHMVERTNSLRDGDAIQRLAIEERTLADISSSGYLCVCQLCAVGKRVVPDRRK